MSLPLCMGAYRQMVPPKADMVLTHGKHRSVSVQGRFFGGGLGAVADVAGEFPETPEFLRRKKA